MIQVSISLLLGDFPELRNWEHEYASCNVFDKKRTDWWKVFSRFRSAFQDIIHYWITSSKNIVEIKFERLGWFLFFFNCFYQGIASREAICSPLRKYSWKTLFKNIFCCIHVFFHCMLLCFLSGLKWKSPRFITGNDPVKQFRVIEKITYILEPTCFLLMIENWRHHIWGFFFLCTNYMLYLIFLY